MAKKRETNTSPLTDAQKLQVKRDNFARVLPPRMDKALKAIRMVGDCTLPTYLFTAEQSNVIVNKLRDAVCDVESRYAGEQGKSGGFELPK